ncbi:MAG TPA: sigma-70 family RNA polymerase sigma factor [Thermoanaerobaculia bacterium]|nr:sigma-70 family RNA polymerase sigma factor [Thermoanaerobaculia bacterium]
MSSGGPAAASTARHLSEILDRASTSVRFRFALDRNAFALRVAEVLSNYAPAIADRARLLASLALDDLYLATACANGEEKAWQEVESAHFPFIRDFALRCARRDPPAGDVAETVIAELWERGKIRQFAGRSSLRTWLGAVVAHTAVNALKRSERTVSLEGEEQATPVGASPGPADEVLARALSEAAARAIGTLDSSDKLLLLFYYEQEMTLEQMERVLGKSKATLSRRLERVRGRLRSWIERHAGRSRADDIDLGRVTLDLARALSAREGAPESVSNSRGGLD